MPEPAYAAVDLGAESGRVVLGHYDGSRIGLEEVHRFENRPVRLPDGMRWNLLRCSPSRCTASPRRPGARSCAASAWTRGASTTRCSTGTTACSGSRSTTATRARTGWSRRRTRSSPRDELYAVTGIQTMPINTVFQLMADRGSAALAAAERIALVPDLFNLG